MLLDDGVADVRPVEAGDETGGAVQAEALADVPARLRIGGGGQGEERHRRKELAQAAELEILGAKIVPPLRDAVRLVDGEQRHRHLLQPLRKASLSSRSGAT